MTESIRTKIIGALPEPLLIAALTGVSYWLTFRYEAGYIGFFGLSPHFVEVSLQTVLAVALAISGTMWIVFLIGNFIAMYWPNHPAIQNKVLRVGFLLLFLIWYLTNVGFRTQDWLFYLVFLAIFVIFEIVWPILIFGSKRTFKERIIADEIAESGPRERGILGRVSTNFGPVTYNLLLILLLGGMVANMAGQVKATTQKEFLLLASDPNIAVIRIYGDTVLAVPFDKTTKTLKSQIIIQKIGIEGLSLSIEKNVGPLARRESAKSVSK